MSTFVPEPQHEQIRRHYQEVPWGRVLRLIGPWLLSLLIGFVLARVAFGLLVFLRLSLRSRAVSGTFVGIVVGALLITWLTLKRRARLASAYEGEADGLRG